MNGKICILEAESQEHLKRERNIFPISLLAIWSGSVQEVPSGDLMTGLHNAYRWIMELWVPEHRSTTALAVTLAPPSVAAPESSQRRIERALTPSLQYD